MSSESERESVSQVLQNPIAESPECYARVAAEIFRAQAAQKSPVDIWASLYKIAEDYGLEAKSVLSAVIDFFVLAGDEDVPFFLDMFRWHNEDFARHGDTRGYTDGRPLLSCDDNDAATKKLVSPVSNEIGLRYGFISRERKDEKAKNATVERFCKAAAILVRENIVHLSDISLKESWRRTLENHSTWFADYTGRKLRELAELDPPTGGKFLDVHYTSRVTVNVNGVVSSSPLIIKLLAALFKEGAAQHATAYLVNHEGLVFHYQPTLTVPFLAYVSSEFDRSSTIGKFQILRLVVSILGPWTMEFEEGHGFFQKACALCKDKLATHATSVDVAIIEFIFPTLSMYQGNHDVAYDVWEALKNADMKRRFTLYRQWQDESYPKMVELQFMEAKMKKHVGFLLKQLKDDTVESVSKSIALIATTNPTIVSRELFEQVSTYERFVPALINAVVSYSGSFVQDVMFWTLIDLLERDSYECYYRGPGNVTSTSKAPMDRLRPLVRSLFATTFQFQGSYLTTFMESLDGRALTHTAGLDVFSNLLSCLSGTKQFTEIAEQQIMALGGSTRLKREVLCPTTVSTLEKVSSDADHTSFKRQPDAILSLFDALRCESLGKRIFMSLAMEHELTDTSDLVKDTVVFRGDDRRTLVLQYLLMILRLGEIDLSDIVPDLKALLDRDAPLSVAMEIARLSLRLQIESRSLGFVDGMSRMIPSPQEIDQAFFVLFWSLESYDVCVPDCDYDREISRLTELKNTMQSSSPSDAVLSRHLECLRKSHSDHTAHVSWMLPRLPMLDISENSSAVDTILNEMVIPRAIRSLVDAHYVFCFLCRTLTNPLPLLDALFDHHTLLKCFTTLTELETRSFTQLLCEILVDVGSWSTYGDLGEAYQKENQEETDESHEHEMESLVDAEIQGSVQDETGDDYSVQTDVVSDSENASDIYDVRRGDSNVVKDEIEAFVARNDASGQNGCSDDDRDSNQTSQSESLTFVDSETDPTYSLFRHGVEFEACAQRWEENISSAMGAALGNREKRTVVNVQQTATRLAKSAPQLQTLWQSLLERHLGPLGKDYISRASEKPEEFLKIYART